MRFDDHCSWIVAQTELLVADLPRASLGLPVPSCPGWTLGALLRHIGGGHRWAAEIVRTRATGFLPDGPHASWFVDLTGEVITWRRGAGPAAVTVRAPLRALLLMVYRRRTPDDLTLTGDAGLLRHWLGHVAFG